MLDFSLRLGKKSVPLGQVHPKLNLKKEKGYEPKFKYMYLRYFGSKADSILNL